MIDRHTFEVVVDLAGKSEIEGVYKEETIAIARAEYLLGLAKYSSVRVSRVDGRGRTATIFEKTYAGGGKVAVVGDLDEASLCRTVGDVYGHDSRMTLLKVMRPYCDEQVMIPAEILHKYMPLRYLERDEMLFGQISRRIAGAQARQLRVGAEARLQELLKLFAQVRELAKDSDDLIPVAEQLGTRGLTGFLAHVEAGFVEADRARIITYAFSQRLNEARDWNRKLIFVCELFKEDQSEAADRCLDEFLSEIVDGNAVIKAAIGYAKDLATALMSLCAALDGAITDRFAHTPALMAVSEVLAVRPMPRLRAALLNRIALALDGKVLLTKSGRDADVGAFRQLVPLLQEYGGFVGGGPMAAALTRRAKITLGQDTADLSIEEAITTMMACFTHNAGRIGYLLDILPTEIGRRNASFVTERVALLLSEIRSIRDLAPANDPTFSRDRVREAFRKRLYLAGIPRKMADALLRKLDAVSAQMPAATPVRGPITVSPGTAPAGPVPAAPAAVSPAAVPASNRTGAAAPSPNRAERCPVLALVYRDRPYVVDSSRETYEIGRNPTSFIVVNNDKVSRLHATIVAKDGKYVLSDQSRNGTTVKLGDQPPVVLNRQSMTLEATGVIGLGVDAREIGNDEMVLISFRLN
jgi:hypothetical protein